MLSRRTEAVIVGAGPAGISAAIQLKRYGISFLLFEKERIGGLLWNANLVENYPGFPDGIGGAKLIGLLEMQMRRIGVEVVYEEVVNADVSLQAPDAERFIVETPRATYYASALIAASGTKPAPFPVTVPEDIKSRVFSDVVRLLDVSDKKIAVVGAGDAAFDHALNLVKKGNFVTILNRGRDVKCLPLLAERIKLQPRILYRDEVAVNRMESNRAGGLVIHCCVRDSAETIEADYLVFAVGRKPQEDFLSATLRGKESELIAAGDLHFIGDVRNGLLRQTAIAAGDGLRAAMQIYLAKG